MQKVSMITQYSVTDGPSLPYKDMVFPESAQMRFST